MPLPEAKPFKNPASIVLVTPVWNDSSRLAVFGQALGRALAAAELPVRWIIADDGSDTNEVERYTLLVKQFKEYYPQVELLRCGVRSCKGGAVYDAWNQAGEADYYAFADADGAVSPKAILSLIEQGLDEKGGSAVVGTRPASGPKRVHRAFLRKVVFLAFRTLVRRLIGARFEDSQCGAKVIPGNAYRRVADKLKERGFIFDVELMVALQSVDVAILEKPITWREVAGSRIRISVDSVQMIRGLFRIRRRQKSGFYRNS
jgi:cellulose synthase/poly-beta-1,6-N-acetylglucosamine synthase-like glycosyltransferase